MTALLKSLLYVVSEEEKAILKQYLIESDSCQQFVDLCDSRITDEALLSQIDPFLLTPNQRILTFTYILIYSKLKKKDEVKKKVNSLLEQLSLDGSIYDLFDKQFPQPTLQKLFTGEDIFAQILAPKDSMVELINKFILRVSQASSIVKKQSLIGLQSHEYEHDYDRIALEKLSHMPGLELVVKKFWEWGIEKFQKIQFTGSNIKVNDKNYPELQSMVRDACRILDIPKIPDLYINIGFLNAMTTGVQNPMIIVDTGCVGLLTYDELLFIIGHELGHIKSQHLLYQQIASALPYIANVVGNLTLGIGSLLGSGIQLALLDWMRKAEFTCDRAGLLVCQNVNAAVSVMMKLAGLPPKYYSTIDTESFLKQADEFEGFDSTDTDKVIKFLSVMGQTHPWTVMRAKELNKWIKQGAYNKIISGHKIQSKHKSSEQVCSNCGAPTRKAQKFCTTCGKQCEK